MKAAEFQGPLTADKVPAEAETVGKVLAAVETAGKVPVGVEIAGKVLAAAGMQRLKIHLVSSLLSAGSVPHRLRS